MTDKDKLDKETSMNPSETAEEPREGKELDPKDQNDDPQEENKDADQDEGLEDKLARENQELKEKYVRLYSEFENFRRRTAKERLELINTASMELVRELIPVIDDFERALKASSQSGEEGNSDQEGSRLIYNKMVKILSSKGLTPMDDLIGKDFDAELHEAITQIPAPSENLKGKIVDVVEKGYMMGEKVIRFAKVVIGN